MQCLEAAPAIATRAPRVAYWLGGRHAAWHDDYGTAKGNDASPTQGTQRQ
jgi:hypothetical protein